MSDSRKYDAGSKSAVNASIATTSVPGSRFSAAPAPLWATELVDDPPQAASKLPADPIAIAPEATPAAPRMNCRRLYRLSEFAIILLHLPSQSPKRHQAHHVVREVSGKCRDTSTSSTVLTCGSRENVGRARRETTRQHQWGENAVSRLRPRC